MSSSSPSSSSPLYHVASFLLTCKDPAGKPFENAQNKAQNTWVKEVEECVTSSGWSSTLFRKLISGLLFEWTQKHVPHEREAGFQQAVLKIVRAQGGATAQYWFPQEDVGPLDATQRTELLRFLAGQVQANRLLEYRVFENADVATDVSEVKVSDEVRAAETALCDVVDVKSVDQAAKIVKELAKKHSSDSSTTSQPLQPVFVENDLNTKLSKEDWALLEELRDTLDKEYTERRRAARSRFAQTLLSLSTSTSASLDKVELRRRGDAELALLSEFPSVGSAHDELLAMRRVELLELVGSVRNKKQATQFKLRSHVIPEVPDRGGRVNTHNFDRKVHDATVRADAQMKGKSQHENRQKQHASQAMHVDASKGVGFMSAQNSEMGMGSRSNSSYQGNSGAQASQAANEIRSRGGGRWSSNRNNNNKQ